jgi:hypothetical protein
MQYAAHLPSPRTLLAPVVALAIGAAGATGIYALSDGTDVQLQPEQVIVVEKPAQSGATTNEAATAAAIGKASQSSAKDEAATAAAIGKGAQDSSFSKDEAATAAAIGKGSKASTFSGDTTGARP